MIRFSIPISFPGPEFFIEIESRGLCSHSGDRRAAASGPPAIPLLRSSVFDTASAPATDRPSRDSASILLLLRSSFPASILLRYMEYHLLVGR
jgi:hypothetical protein